jgi:hypothetical protein
MSLIPFVVGALVVVACGVAIPWRRRQLATKKLLMRDALDDESIYSRFYASSGLSKSEVLRVWHEIADSLRVPADRLRPDDRFGKEIGAYWITSDDLDVLAEKGRKRANELGLSVDLSKLSTVDAYVRHLVR